MTQAYLSSSKTIVITITMMVLVLVAPSVVDAFVTPPPAATAATAATSTSTATITTVATRRTIWQRNARFSRSPASPSKSSSPLLEEALDAYPYSFDSKRSAVTRDRAIVAFNELARLYGDREALQMVKTEPRALAFDSSNYGPCLESWTEQFGLEASRGMVQRNPGLLGVKPFTAREPAEASMFFSYLVALGRPLPKIIGAGLLLSVATAGFH